MIDEDRDYHNRVDAHRPESRLRDIILGGQDGLVNTLGVLLGVAAATGDPRVVLAAGFAATFAESVSMGAVAYTSTLAERALYDSEVARERRHIERVPALEADEVREIYRQKGLEGALLEQVVVALTSNKEVWLAVMLSEEHRLKPVPRGRPLGAALIVGLSALVGSLVPLVPFLFLAIHSGIVASLVVSAVTLFAVGGYKAQLTDGRWLRSGLEMTAIGMASAAVGFFIGHLFHVSSA